jgi:kynurenine formamidase
MPAHEQQAIRLLDRHPKTPTGMEGYRQIPRYLRAKPAATTFEPERGKTPSRKDSTTHHAFFPAGITVIEYLTNLDQIGAPRRRFIALPLAVEGADGSPVRAVAVVK